NHILLTGQFDYAWNTDDLQYVGTIAPSPSNNGNSQPAYIMGRMKQETYGLTLNLQANITPDFSIQYYGSPFTSVAEYDKFKQAGDTHSRTYTNRFSEFGDNEIGYDA